MPEYGLELWSLSTRASIIPLDHQNAWPPTQQHQQENGFATNQEWPDRKGCFVSSHQSQVSSASEWLKRKHWKSCYSNLGLSHSLRSNPSCCNRPNAYDGTINSMADRIKMVSSDNIHQCNQYVQSRNKQQNMYQIPHKRNTIAEMQSNKKQVDNQFWVKLWQIQSREWKQFSWWYYLHPILSLPYVSDCKPALETNTVSVPEKKLCRSVVISCKTFKQESIPVGCVLPACQPYVFWRLPLGVSILWGDIPTPLDIPTHLLTDTYWRHTHHPPASDTCWSSLETYCSPRGQNDWQTAVKTLPFPDFVYGW